MSWLRDIRQMHEFGVLAPHPLVTYPGTVAQAGVLDHNHAPLWLSHTPTRAQLFDATGWTPQPDLEWERVQAGFAHAAFQAYRRHLVAAARAVELMREQIKEADLPSQAGEDVEP